MTVDIRLLIVYTVITTRATAQTTATAPQEGAESEYHMSTYYIRDLEQAKAIIAAYERCSSCDRCPLCTPEGWRCSYLYDCAVNYIERHDVEKEG